MMDRWDLTPFCFSLNLELMMIFCVLVFINLLSQVELKTTPFETYNLMRGQASGSMFGNTLKVSLCVQCW